MSGFKVEFSILNLRATPGIYADALASRPAAGYPGRVFIDTDNPSTGIYRDTGTVWVQIAETATSDVDTLQNVTDNGNTTTNSISVGHANTPVSTIDVRQSTSGLNNASNWTITANNNPTIASGATFGTNYVNAIYGAQTQLFLQNATIGNSGLNTAGLFINTLQSNAPGSPGIITVTQASTIRAISGAQTGIFYGGTNVGVTYSHVAALKTFQPINTGSAATVTNNYGIIVADSTPSSGTVTYTNRWGIYQEGASDKNYFAANVLIKSTTDNGNALQVTGNGNITGNLGIGTTSPAVKLQVIGDIATSTRVATDLINGYTGSSTPLTIQTGGTQSIIFGTNNTERMRITSGGNVGIGLTNPAQRFVIRGQNGNSALEFDNKALNTEIVSYDRVASAYRDLYLYASSASPTMVLNTSGNVGIGTTNPQTQLDIANGLMFGTIDAFPSATYDAAAVIAKTGSLGSAPFNNAGSIVYRARVTSTAGRSSHIFYTGSPSTERMRLDESGNLGINTTSINASALVEMTSTTKGLLIPRMTATERDNIVSPAIGLLIFNTTTNRLNIYDGAWIAVH